MLYRQLLVQLLLLEALLLYLFILMELTGKLAKSRDNDIIQQPPF